MVLRNEIDRKLSEEINILDDRRSSLELAAGYLEEAIDDSLWSDLLPCLSAPWKVPTLPSSILAAWKETSIRSSSILSSGSLLELRQLNTKGQLKDVVVQSGLSKRREDIRLASEDPVPPRPTKRKTHTGPEFSKQHIATGPRCMPSRLTIFSYSAKVDYIVRSILAAPDSKFVIFADSLPDFRHLTDALDLAEITSLVLRGE
jgi:hypothetical protein